MSNRIIDIIIKAKDEASGVVKNAGENVSNMGNTMKQGLGIAVAAAGAASIAMVAYARAAIDEAQSQIRANTQLEQVLKSTGNAVGFTSTQIQDMAGSMQDLYAIGDDVIQQGQNMLLTFTNIRGEAFEKATVTMLDMATAMNGGLTPSAEQLSAQAIQLGKALNDPINGISALSRVGVSFTEEQKASIATFVAQNDIMGAQKVILEELGKEFGGQAAAQAATFEGRMRSMNLVFADIKEAIGIALIPVLQSLMEKFAPIIKQWAEGVEVWASNKENIDKLSNAISTFGTILGTVGDVIGFFRNTLTAFGDRLANGIATWIYLFGVFKEGASAAWTGLQANVKAVIDFIVGAWDAAVGKIMAAVDRVKAAFNSVKSGISNIGNGISNGATNAVNTVGGRFKASGGVVDAGTSYIVGENGAERFVPMTSGYIVPNDSMGSKNISINLGNVNVYNEADENRLVAKIKESLEREVSLYKIGLA